MTKQMYRALFALAISAFAIGTTEFVIVGLLETVADDLAISLTTAGSLVSGYALALAIGTPILAVVFSGMNKKRLLVWLMVVFTIGNALGVIAPTYEWLMVSRVVTAVAHGLFFAMATIVATRIVPATKQGTAVSIMFTGLTVATILGVPLGTWVGQSFSWRTTFGVVAVLGVIGLLAILTSVQQDKQQIEEKTTLRDIGALVKNPHILGALTMTILGFGATFVLFTYMAPILSDVSGYASSSITWILLLYGVFVAIGNIIGGRIADKEPLKGLRFVFLAQAVILALQYVLLPEKFLALVAISLLGLVAFMMSAGVQTHIVQLAERYVPSAKGMASALNISAFNIGIALGSTLGSVVLAVSDVLNTAFVGAGMALLASLLAMVSYNKQKERLG
ncbi:MFS transporter [Exiguobacterium sp. s37]|uniref:MFS transporter n=1 Tax=Exiguobacterium sp. s37 TaxID=2751275 RepID=UPI001BE7890D|nr:MFS transporter [Exiguobacterium sp. s37]